MKRLILTAFLAAILFAGCLPAQEMQPQTDIDHYVLTFYAVSDTIVSPAFLPGDTLSVQWIQPASRTAYDKQPDPVFGHHSGAKYTVEIQNGRVHYASDSLASVNQVVILPKGAYELTIMAVDLRGNHSKESQPFPFVLVSGAPAVPVEVKILIQRGS